MALSTREFFTPAEKLMTFYMNRNLAIALMLGIPMLSCADDQIAPVSVLIAPEPIEYRMEYSLHTVASILGAWGPMLANKARNNSLSSSLTIAMMRHGSRPNKLLRESTQRKLNELGIAATEVNFPINPTDQSKVNYSEAAKNNSILHVYFERIGVQSRHSSKTYTPFAHVFYCFVPSGKKSCDETSDRGYYGEGYEEKEPLVIPADIRFQWADSDDVMRRLGDFDAAIDSMAAQMGIEVAEAVGRHIKQ